jgi:hypothetical protein
MEDGSIGDEAFDSPLERGALVVNFELASIVVGVVVDCQALTIGVAGLNSPDSLAAGDGSPDLVGATCAVPLDDLGLGILLFTGDIDSLSVEDRDEEVSLSVLLPSPALVEAFVLLPLYESFSMFEGGGGDVEGLAGVGIDEDAGAVQGVTVVYWHDVEELVGGVGVAVLVLEDALEADGFVALAGGLEPPAVSGLLELEELVGVLLAELEAHIAPFLIPDEVGLAVHDFKLIISMANFFDHPELSEIMLVRLSSNDLGSAVVFVVISLNSEGLVAFVADDLIDVSSGELKGTLHDMEFEYNISFAGRVYTNVR